jgi:hypothetical protein
MWGRVDIVRTDVSDERRFIKDLHDPIYRKTAFFIVTAVKISNLTWSLIVGAFDFSRR